jgi:hypothetical protein
MKNKKPSGKKVYHSNSEKRRIESMKEETIPDFGLPMEDSISEKPKECKHVWTPMVTHENLDVCSGCGTLRPVESRDKKLDVEGAALKIKQDMKIVELEQRIEDLEKLYETHEAFISDIIFVKQSFEVMDCRLKDLEAKIDKLNKKKHA